MISAIRIGRGANSPQNTRRLKIRKDRGRRTQARTYCKRCRRIRTERTIRNRTRWKKTYYSEELV